MAEDGGFSSLARALSSYGIEFAVLSAEPGTVSGAVGELGLPLEFAELYTQFGPAPRSAVPWVVEQLRVFSIGELPDALEGYRWSGPRRETLDGWPASWVVVAAVGGDAFFVDVSRPGPPVFFAAHGAGRWRPRRVAPSMAVFIAALAAFESVLVGEFGGDPWNEDGPVPGFLPAVNTRLSALLDADDLVNFLETLN